MHQRNNLILLIVFIPFDLVMNEKVAILRGYNIQSLVIVEVSIFRVNCLFKNLLFYLPHI